MRYGLSCSNTSNRQHITIDEDFKKILDDTQDENEILYDQSSASRKCIKYL